VTLPITGAVSSVGEAMHNGLQLAASETKHISVEFLVEEDATADRIKAVSAAKKLVDGVWG
jgi:ABC-type branched-subunit amino acid transport system substrate-binding protein